MVNLTAKILASFEKDQKESVKYFAENKKSNVKELNETIVLLSKQAIYPQLVSLSDDFINLEFTKF